MFTANYLEEQFEELGNFSFIWNSAYWYMFQVLCEQINPLVASTKNKVKTQKTLFLLIFIRTKSNGEDLSTVCVLKIKK